jgi:XTP/dITP diphosphohydrolase
MKKLVLASNNPGKLREFAQMLATIDFEVLPQAKFDVPEAEEPHVTFIENALAKARHAARLTGLPALADDSGICITALGGAPGVYSARWAGPEKDFAAAMRSVEEKLQALGATAPGQRKAHFVAVLALAFPDGSVDLFRGEVHGHLVYPPRGLNGFGYDPMFVPSGNDATFGEMNAERKQTMSHRARAFAKFAEARLPK